MSVVKEVKRSNTNDQDLVELAGYHSYQHYETGNIITVNRKEFIVKQTTYNTSSGLDALTVENNITKEITIVFVGSEDDKDWLETNPRLLSEVPPKQIEDAKQYYIDMKRKYGEIHSVTGNSLAGALTNSVAMDHPELKAITLNPAILPAGMVDSNKEYSNITNYYSQFDFLTGTEESLGLGNRIPGNKYNINNGIPIFSSIGPNHTGYVDMDKDQEFKVEIGIKGEPGYGFIHVGADDHIVTSIWTGEPIYYGNSEKIKINKASMTLLADGIRDQVKGRITNMNQYLENSIDIVKDESAKFVDRVKEFQETFQTMLEETAGEPMMRGIAGTGTIIKLYLLDMIDLLDCAEEKCRFLNSILNSAPMELVENLLSVDISVESFFEQGRRNLNNLCQEVDEFVYNAQNVITKDIPDLFKGGTDQFIDAVVDENNAHYEIIRKNKQSLHHQLTEYSEQV
ncbi:MULTISPECIES: SA1320 family protein [Bacillus]|uniref:SA1320 family protein n=1 Tax=Bacillus TaxID=1386 RepID=UPI0002D9E825|nr:MULTISPECIES: hypothetical protein [Bacillus]